MTPQSNKEKLPCPTRDLQALQTYCFVSEPSENSESSDINNKRPENYLFSLRYLILARYISSLMPPLVKNLRFCVSMRFVIITSNWRNIVMAILAIVSSLRFSIADT